MTPLDPRLVSTSQLVYYIPRIRDEHVRDACFAAQPPDERDKEFLLLCYSFPGSDHLRSERRTDNCFCTVTLTAEDNDKQLVNPSLLMDAVSG